MTGKKWKIHKYVEIEQHSLKNLGVETELKREIKNCLRWMKKKYNIPKLMGYSKSSSQREVYNNK